MNATVPYDELAEIYEVWVANMASVAEDTRRFYTAQYVASGGPVVELGVGNGRILVGAAKAGKEVTGVDSSEGMLALCRRKAEEAGVADRVHLMRADFRDFTLPAPAALIAIPYDSLGHLVALEAMRACLRNVRAQLAPGGRFLFDMKVPRPPGEGDRRPYLYATFTNPSTGCEVLLWITIVHDVERQVRRSYLWTEEIGADSTVKPRKIWRVENAWLFPAQLRRMLTEIGFEVEAIHGDFKGGPMTEKAEYQLVVARRP